MAFSCLVLCALLVAGCGGGNNAPASTVTGDTSRVVTKTAVQGDMRYTLSMKESFVQGEPVVATYTIENLGAEPAVRSVTGPLFRWRISRGVKEVYGSNNLLYPGAFENVRIEPNSSRVMTLSWPRTGEAETGEYVITTHDYYNTTVVPEPLTFTLRQK